MTVIGTHFATLIAALALLATSAPAAEPRIPQTFIGDWCIQHGFENQTLALARCPHDTYDFPIGATKVDMVGDVLCDVVEAEATDVLLQCQPIKQGRPRLERWQMIMRGRVLFIRFEITDESHASGLRVAPAT
jgi:hypothetical protein